MTIATFYAGRQLVAPSWQGGAVTIGNFDGVHLGHAALMSRLTYHAARVQGPAIAFTFAPHPGDLLSPQGAPPPLCELSRKVELLTQLGVTGVWAYPTDRALLELSPEAFFQQMVVEQLRARVIVEGDNFCFGKDRAGDIERLQSLCEAARIALEIVPAEKSVAGAISSSRIRAAIQAGDVAAAHHMLTRPHRIAGQVVLGEQRGRTLGFPTANLAEITTLVPAFGVYAGWARTEKGDWPAAIHIGPNVTFGETHAKVEAHLIGFSGDLYRQRLEIDFLRQLRHIHPFPNVDALQRQLRDDVATAVQVCEAYRAGRSPSPPKP